MAHDNTVRLHRVLRAPPERVYKAFVTPEALVKWIAPHGFVAKILAWDPQVGGTCRMAFTNLGTGSSHSFATTYVELVPGERLRYTDQFDDPNLPGQMSVTVTLTKVLCGTELHITQEGVPPVIPLEFCYAGWQESLQLLALLVDPEIPDAGP
ncbi:MAG: SRPBCC family protein [Kofleriaceae bacterium]|jgi:uncharacterized protein YndB with AHSA1/START domain|nr:SRPBCC family protein [Kofleriaceae bacterium]MBP9172110.1 SRPBCC family protein [Kofleriaceae bacterium]MBP9859573.1 SRPBCC family protein [Kofleriaceae bacterium]